ncbi:MAG TPA: YceI family protein [Kiritimatiellia bacterium]|nr:YceI family protein [Kiritimatiellia bacterium]
MKQTVKAVLVGLIAVGFALPQKSQADVYEIDTAHSSIGFSVRHMVIANVRGQFKTFSGSVNYVEDDATAFSASAEVDVASIDTNNDKRDDHLRSGDFFDAESHPAITFNTTKIEGNLPDITLIGELSIRGVTKEIALPISIVGPITDPWGNQRIGFSGSTRINRHDYGVSWSKTMDGGGLVVGDEVRLIIDIEAIKK